MWSVCVPAALKCFLNQQNIVSQIRDVKYLERLLWRWQEFLIQINTNWMLMHHSWALPFPLFRSENVIQSHMSPLHQSPTLKCTLGTEGNRVWNGLSSQVFIRGETHLISAAGASEEVGGLKRVEGAKRNEGGVGGGCGGAHGGLLYTNSGIHFLCDKYRLAAFVCQM